MKHRIKRSSGGMFISILAVWGVVKLSLLRIENSFVEVFSVLVPTPTLTSPIVMYAITYGRVCWGVIKAQAKFP